MIKTITIHLFKLLILIKLILKYRINNLISIQVKILKIINKLQYFYLKKKLTIIMDRYSLQLKNYQFKIILFLNKIMKTQKLH